MINKLYEAVAAGLKAVKECSVYREDVPQKFKRPSFLVTIYDQDPSRGINGRLKNSVSMDVLYFSGEPDGSAGRVLEHRAGSDAGICASGL